MSVKTIALIGNQNAGKTTLFNGLTGANQSVGNWPGVTVDKTIGKISSSTVARLREARRNHVNDITIAQTGLPDCCNTGREVDPRTLAANQAEDSFFMVDLPGLYSLSPYSAEEVVSREYLLSNDYDVVVNVVDATHLERTLSLTLEVIPMGRPMVVAINMMDLAAAQNIKIDIKALEQKLGVRCVPVVASDQKGLVELFAAIEEAAVPRTPEFLPAEMTAAIKEIGSQLSDLRNDGERHFVAASLIEGDRIYAQRYQGVPALQAAIEGARRVLLDKYNTDAETLLAQSRYAFIDEVMAEAVTHGKTRRESISEQIDKVVTNRFLAFPIFLFTVYMIYYLAVSTIGTWSTDFANDVVFGEWCTDGATVVLEAMAAPEWLSSLVIDGIIGGVGAVLGFVPQMVVLFLLLAFLEQCGYMTRVAFTLDRFFRFFGLSGKSFIPLIVASGCGVPALMATKTVDNINERRIGLISTTFIPCSAKFPIIVMIMAAFFPDSTLIAPGIYLFAILAVAISGVILKKSSAFHEEVSPFVMEMPDYHWPTLRNILRSTYLRCKAFVIKAGTVIFTVVIAVWFLSSFGFGEEGFGQVDIENSLLANIGNAITFIFVPLGFATWQASVAVFTGLLAKENVVGTMAVLLQVGSDVAEDDASLSQALNGHFATAMAALSYLAFNLFSTPCVAALGAMKRQLGHINWFYFAIVYQLLFAYVVSLVIYQLVGLVVGEVAFSVYTVFAVAALIAALYLVFRPEQRRKTSMRIASRTV